MSLVSVVISPLGFLILICVFMRELIFVLLTVLWLQKTQDSWRETEKFVTAKVVAQNDQSRRKMKRIISFTIASKSIKYLEINLNQGLVHIAEGN